MCLIKYYDSPNWKNLPRKQIISKYVKIVKRNKIVYKSFKIEVSNKATIEIVSPYTAFIWPRGKAAKVKNLGVYCYFSQLRVNEGIHACITKMDAARYSRDVIEKMVIPKGAQYVIGNNGDIVATEMWLKSDYDKFKRPKRRNTTTSKARVSKISKKKHVSTTNRKRKV